MDISRGGVIECSSGVFRPGTVGRSCSPGRARRLKGGDDREKEEKSNENEEDTGKTGEDGLRFPAKERRKRNF